MLWAELEELSLFPWCHCHLCMAASHYCLFPPNTWEQSNGKAGAPCTLCCQHRCMQPLNSHRLPCPTAVRRRRFSARGVHPKTQQHILGQQAGAEPRRCSASAWMCGLSGRSSRCRTWAHGKSHITGSLWGLLEVWKRLLWNILPTECYSVFTESRWGIPGATRTLHFPQRQTSTFHTGNRKRFSNALNL